MVLVNVLLNLIARRFQGIVYIVSSLFLPSCRSCKFVEFEEMEVLQPFITSYNTKLGRYAYSIFWKFSVLTISPLYFNDIPVDKISNELFIEITKPQFLIQLQLTIE